MKNTTPESEVAPEKMGFFIVALVFAIVLGLAISPLLDFVHYAGRYLVPHDLDADYVTAMYWATALGLSILIWPINRGDRYTLLILWFVKIGVALGFMLFFESVFTSLDSFGYFWWAMTVPFTWTGTGWGEGRQNMIASAMLHNRFLPESYHAMKISFAMIGFLAVYIFYRAAVAAGALAGRKLLVGLSLMPSILFWSSVVQRDPVILLGVAIYSYGVVRWARGAGLQWLLLAALGTLVAVWFRSWLGPIMAVPAVVLALMGEGSRLQKSLLVGLAGVALAVGVSQMGTMFFKNFTLDIVEVSNLYSRYFALGGSVQKLEAQFTSVPQMIRFLPLGMFTALLRPLPGDVGGMFGALASLENVGLLCLLGVAAWRTKLRELKEPLVLWALVFLLSWGSLYGFISYNNLGTAARYRLQVLPIFLLLLLYLARRRDRSLTSRKTTQESGTSSSKLDIQGRVPKDNV